MELTIDKLWSTLFIDTPVSKLKKLGKEKFLRNYIEKFEKNNNHLLDVNTRIDMAAIIDVVETRDDPLGGMNFAQTVEATNADMLRAVTEWIQNYQNQGYTNIDDKIIDSGNPISGITTNEAQSQIMGLLAPEEDTANENEEAIDESSFDQEGEVLEDEEFEEELEDEDEEEDANNE